MKKVIVASKNGVKIDAARIAFEQSLPQKEFEFIGISVPSGVSDQPMTERETYEGAANRVVNAKREVPDADFWVAFEGGLEDKNGEMESCVWVIVESASGKVGKAQTARFYLPESVAELVRGGKELGEADDIVFGLSNSKQANGSVGILTKDLIPRREYYVHAAILALIPFANPDLY